MNEWQQDAIEFGPSAKDRRWQREQALFIKQAERAKRARARQPRPFPEPHIGGRTSYVYFIQAEDGGPVKIGWTFNAQKRLRAFQSASPYKLVIRKVIVGTQRLESYLHKRYESYRLEGEWFEPQPDMPGCLHEGGISTADWLDSPKKIRRFEEEAWERREVERLSVVPPKRPRNRALDEMIEHLDADGC